MTHNLKMKTTFFQAAWVGKKPFEVRLNDRNFQVHDEIVLEEWDMTEHEYTGRQVFGVITYLTSFEQKEGYVVFAYEMVGRGEE